MAVAHLSAALSSTAWRLWVAKITLLWLMQGRAKPVSYLKGLLVRYLKQRAGWRAPWLERGQQSLGAPCWTQHAVSPFSPRGGDWTPCSPQLLSGGAIQVGPKGAVLKPDIPCGSHPACTAPSLSSPFSRQSVDLFSISVLLFFCPGLAHSPSPRFTRPLWPSALIFAASSLCSSHSTLLPQGDLLKIPN